MKKTLYAAWLAGSVVALPVCAAGPNGRHESEGRPAFLAGSHERGLMGASAPSAHDAHGALFRSEQLSTGDALGSGGKR